MSSLKKKKTESDVILIEDDNDVILTREVILIENDNDVIIVESIFDKLPNEIILMITKYLSLEDLKNFRLINKKLNKFQKSIPIDEFEITPKYFDNRLESTETYHGGEIIRFKTHAFKNGFFKTEVPMLNKFMKIDHIIFNTFDWSMSRKRNIDI